MSVRLAIGAILGALVATLSVLSQVELWQRKEYRWDRMRSFLLSPESSSARSMALLIGFLAVGLGWIAFLLEYGRIAEWLGWAALLLPALHHGRRIARRGVLRPVPTLKANLLIGIAIVVAGIYLFGTFVPAEIPVLQLATLIFFLPFLVAMAVVLVNAAAFVRKQQVVQAAACKRSGLKNLKVIGITGSYGKTSTKHFLAQIVESAGKKVQATTAHHNTPMGVAADIMRLSDDTDVFVVEMGAYRKGEIAALAQLAQPSVGVITAIGNQHLDLFGSQEAILHAKWELTDALPSEGVAVLNKDDERLVQRAKMWNGKVMWYSLAKPADVWFERMAIKPERVRATIHIGSEVQDVSIPVAGTGLCASVAAAIAAAYAVRVSPKEIFSGIQALKPFERTMEIRAGVSGSIVIDDSYSANEAGVLNALEHLSRFSQKDRRVVLLPLIELGGQGSAVHQRIGKALANTGARVFVAGAAYREDIQTGTKKSGKSIDISFFSNPVTLQQEVSEGLSQDSVILLEGRIPEVVRRNLLA